MNISVIETTPAADLAESLAIFEREFSYPLETDRAFHISHGADYSRFFRAMGEGRVFVAQQRERVIGTLGVALRDLTLPDGNTHRTAYLGDIKIAADARSGIVLHRLARAAEAWIRPRVRSALGIVMHGTTQLPHGYSGRAGVPGFEAIAEIAVARYRADIDAADACPPLSAVDGETLFGRLARDTAFAKGGDPRERSQSLPTWLASSDGQAVGRLEDTLRAKRLLIEGGGELRSAHLACFAAQTSKAAAAVVSAARRRVAAMNLEGVFVAIDSTRASLLPPLRAGDTITGATLYAAELPRAMVWSVSSSEI